VYTLSCSQDETILPTDFKKAGVIVDDDLNAMMVRPLMPGVTLHALIDACHSGTAMDLPYRAKMGSDGRFTWKVCRSIECRCCEFVGCWCSWQQQLTELSSWHWRFEQPAA
jgi:hypothetical protein